jgi:hypothetical protein
MKPKYILYIVIASIIIIGSIIGGFCWQLSALKNENSRLREEYNLQSQKITESIIRSETKRVRDSSDLEEFIKSNGTNISKVKEDLKNLGARMLSTTTTTAETKNIYNYYVKSDKGPEITSKNKVPECKGDGRPIDLHGYTREVQHHNVDDSNGMRLAQVSFDASSKRPWSETVYKIRYKTNSVTSKTNNGTIVVHTQMLASNEKIQPGKVFELEVVDSTTLQTEEKPRFKFFDPGLYLSLNAGIIVWNKLGFSLPINLNFSLMSYGEWKFLAVGIGLDTFEKSFDAQLIPFLYNIGDPIPLLTNLYIYPYVGVDHRVNTSIGLGLGVRL